MTYIDETIQQLETHLAHLLDRAEETTYPITLINRYGQTVGQDTITPSAIIDEAAYTQKELQHWNHHKQQDKQR